MAPDPGASSGATGANRALATLLRPSPRPPLHERTTNPSDEVHTRSLAGLEGEFRILARQLSAPAAAGRFSVIIADDTTGRVPALIIRDALNRHLRAHGKAPLPIVFWQTSGAGHQQAAMAGALQDRLPHLRALNATSRRALVITDWVCSGGHLRAITEHLGAAGITAEAATIGVSRGARVPPGMRIYSANSTDITVNGLFPHSLVSGMSRDKYIERPVLTGAAAREAAVTARRDARILAARIAATL